MLFETGQERVHLISHANSYLQALALLLDNPLAHSPARLVKRAEQELSQAHHPALKPLHHLIPYYLVPQHSALPLQKEEENISAYEEEVVAPIIFKNLENADKEKIIQETLIQSKWNRGVTAEVLGINRSTLWRWENKMKSKKLKQNDT